MARLAAREIGQYGVDPAGTTAHTAGAEGTEYFRRSRKSGDQSSPPALHGHRDGYDTRLLATGFYAELPTPRASAAGRHADTTRTADDGYRSWFGGTVIDPRRSVAVSPRR
ncbi:hypothetical protein ABZ137_35585 [Streptomyces bobili]|uniref:hypothetical protein n=1 Tax=Streptomyces bobili TaxID=67280 RepID=UPI0033A000C3